MTKLLPLLMLLFFSAGARAQDDIPIGSWRTHFSYAQVHEVALAGSRVYAASENGFFYYDKPSNEVVELGPLRGFSDAGVSTLQWQAQSSLLLIGYGSGNIDLLQNGKVINIPTIRNANIAGSKAIRSAAFRGDSVILATDYGISILQLPQARLADSYLNLGPEGISVEVYGVAVLEDTLFAATDRGLIANRMSGSVNLNDFRSWRRWGAESGLPEEGTHFVVTIGEQLWSANRAGGLYQKSGAFWLPAAFNEADSIVDLQVAEAGDALIITTSQAVYRYLPGQHTYSIVSSEPIREPLTAVQDAAGIYWVGEAFNGLLTNAEGSFSRRSPDGPISDAVSGLRYAYGQVLALYGGSTANGNPLGRRGFSAFTTTRGWTNFHPQQRAGVLPMPDAQDLVAAAFSTADNSWYLASYGDGLLSWRPEDNTFTLYSLNTEGVSFSGSRDLPGRVLLSGVGVDRGGRVWMSSYNSNRPLHRFNPAELSWQAYLEGNTTAAGAQQLIIPYTNDIWLRLRPRRNNTEGILVFNPEKQPELRTLNENLGRGGLTSNQVYSLQEDLEGSVWVGTQDGVVYVPNPAAVLTQNDVDAALPIYQQRPLLDESLITAIAVDGGNRKWIGTRSGVWLVGDAGDTLYQHFTAANSPLPSNNILAIAIHQQTGEVFIATDQGLVSYRSGATAGGISHAAAIKIFPNPVRPGYRGQVGITGLVQDAVVKITDTAGYLVRELGAEGGTAAWDLRDSRGNEVATGIYLVFSANALGTEALVGKLAVVR
ncbi:transcriptional regulator [Flammeovirgaceae bacterium 311]|nr:transcriptional regulator [Flammeovirgaceae bacterium 311]